MKLFYSLLLSIFFSFTLLAQDWPSTSWASHTDTDWYSSSESVFTITNAEQLAGLSKLVAEGRDFEGKFINLAQNIDLGEHLWKPIGTEIDYSFKGTFEGNNHTIENLKINLPTGSFAGFFGSTIDATINDLNFTSSQVLGLETVGTVVGNAQSTHINNITVVDGTLINVDGVDSGIAGGLVGGLLTNASLKNSSFTGNVEGTNQIGGLVGTAWNSTLIEYCWTGVGTIIGDNIVGGLVGYTTMNFPPEPETENVLRFSYSRMDVSANGQFAGGVYGYPETNAEIYNCYSTGNVQGIEDVGASIGGIMNQVAIEQVFFDKETSGVTNGLGFTMGEEPAGIVGKTTSEMKNQVVVDLLNENYESYNNGNGIWQLQEGVNDGYPVFWTETSSLTKYTLEAAVKIYPTITSNSLTIEANEHFEYQLFDMQGREVERGKTTGNNTLYSVENLQKGMYRFVFTNDKSSKSLFFIKN